jgi:hypothetical protein
MSPTRAGNVARGVGLERVEHLPGGDLVWHDGDE